jgi:hypothetical protein
VRIYGKLHLFSQLVVAIVARSHFGHAAVQLPPSSQRPPPSHTEGDPKQIRQLAIHHRTRRPTCHTHAGLHQKTHELVKAKNKGRPGSSRLWRRRCPSLRRTAATGSSTTSRRSRGTRPRPRPTPGHSRLASVIDFVDTPFWVVLWRRRLLRRIRKSWLGVGGSFGGNRGGYFGC